MKTLVSTLAILVAAPALAQAATPAPTPTTILIGQTLAGTLSASDETWDDGSHFDRYRFHATAGQKIRIEMNTPRNVLTDDFLTLEAAGGDGKNFLAHDDDGADAPLDALIVYTIPTTGDYDIRASGVKKDDLGEYTISVWQDGKTKPAVATTSAPSKPTTAASTASTSSGASSADDEPTMMLRPTKSTAISVGQTVNGTLAAGDQKDEYDYYMDTYTFTGKKGDKLLISAHSGEFDTVLDLSEANSLVLLTMDDDITTGTDSAIQTQLTKDGTYTIQITAQGSDGREDGAYTLSLKTDPAPMTEDELDTRDYAQIFFGDNLEAPKDTNRTNISYGQTLNGTLATSDKYTTGDKSDEKYYFDTYMFRVAKGDKVTVTVNSTAFQPDFTMFDLYNQFYELSDNKDGKADVTTTIDREGLYRLDVMSEDANKTGAYTVNIRK